MAIQERKREEREKEKKEQEKGTKKSLFLSKKDHKSRPIYHAFVCYLISLASTYHTHTHRTCEHFTFFSIRPHTHIYIYIYLQLHHEFPLKIGSICFVTW